MAFSVGDLVVSNGLPGVITAVQTAAGATVYQVSFTASQVRWLNANQFVGPSPPTAGATVLVGSTPATVIRVWPGGPYPLYLVEMDQVGSQWMSAGQLNPPLPPAQPVPPAPPAPPAPAGRK